ncbi:MAG: hypothetical protein H7318_19405, partial [Oligoflexus sp.]|nr:hypothetical protein [Oligoflexus sp.]
VSSQVIKTDPLTLGRLGLGWVKDLSTGGIGRSDALNRRAEIIDFFND